MITVSTAGMVAYRVSILGETIDLRTIPSIVGGDQEKRHGIVLAKSVPAKKYGIQTGEAIMTAKQKCPGLVIVPPDYGLYVTASRAFIGILKQYSDNVIQYSIDEAWVVFDGYESLYGRGQMVKFAHSVPGRNQAEDVAVSSIRPILRRASNDEKTTLIGNQNYR